MWMYLNYICLFVLKGCVVVLELIHAIIHGWKSEENLWDLVPHLLPCVSEGPNSDSYYLDPLRHLSDQGQSFKVVQSLIYWFLAGYQTFINNRAISEECEKT